MALVTDDPFASREGRYGMQPLLMKFAGSVVVVLSAWLVLGVVVIGAATAAAGVSNAQAPNVAVAAMVPSAR